jgi:hypothetical protein
MDVNQEILQRLTRVETKLDMYASAKDTANEALEISKDAHRRIEKIDKMIWFLGTTIIGTIAVSVVTFILRGGLK